MKDPVDLRRSRPWTPISMGASGWILLGRSSGVNEIQVRDMGFMSNPYGGPRSANMQFVFPIIAGRKSNARRWNAGKKRIYTMRRILKRERELSLRKTPLVAEKI